MLSHLARAIALILAATGLVTLAQTSTAAGGDRDCDDFNTQAQAQAFFNNAGPGDPHRLDGDDNDGRACETLPCPCAGSNNNPPPPGPVVHRETGNVVRIIDGDTLRVRLRSGATVSVRLLGINTPERGRCGTGEATDNLRNLAPVGSTVNLVSDPSQAVRDRYGRLLRYVAKQGGYRDLSFRQMHEGYSKPYVFSGDPVARHHEYVRASSAADRADRGLWATCWS